MKDRKDTGRGEDIVAEEPFGTGGGVSHLRVGAASVGLVALSEALREVAALGLEDDEAAARELLARVKMKNYVPAPREEDYRLALLAAYRAARGEAPPAALPEGGPPRVLILGAGCPRCAELHRAVLRVCAREGIAADVEHVKDVREIARLGVVSTPALVVNGKVRAAGRLPSERDLAALLREAAR